MKNSKLIFVSLCFVLFFIESKAQTVSMTEDLILRNDKAYFLVGEFEDKFVLFRDMDNEYRMHTYDKMMLPVDNIEFEFDFKSVDIIDVLPNGKKHFNIFYTAKKKNKFYFNVEKYNIKSELIESKTLYVKDGIYDTPDFELVVSENENKLLFYSVEAKDELKILVVDNDSLSLVKDTYYENLEVDLFYDLAEMLVDNKGDFYAIIEKSTGFSQRKNPYFLICYSGQNDQELDQFKIEFEEKKNYYSKFKIDNLNNRITAGGLFAEKNVVRAKGYYYLSVPIDNKENYTLAYNSFDEEFLKEYLNKKSINKKTGMIDGQVQEIILRRDGGILLIGEKIKRKNRQSPNGNHRTDVLFRADYYFEELFLVSIHPDGSEHWTNIIHKKQFSFDDEAVFSSFYPVKTSSSLNILFNDEIRSQSTVSEFSLKGNGEYKRRAILNTRDLEVKLRIKDSLQIAANTIVVPSQFRNKLKLVKFEF